MRNSLKSRHESRTTFYGTFKRNGTRPGWITQQPTLLLVDIRDEIGNVVADHLWFALTKGFETLGLIEGERVRFVARVEDYMKGYMGRRLNVYKPVERDYRLSRPTQIKKLPPIGPVTADKIAPVTASNSTPLLDHKECSTIHNLNTSNSPVGANLDE